MKLGSHIIAIVLAMVMSGAAWSDGPDAAREQVKAEALRGFEEILDLWRGDDYGALYSRLVHTPGSDTWKFADQLNHSGRRPACCWEKLQDVTVTVLDQGRVEILARLGIEVEGVGTRFVTRSFSLVKAGGVWRLPEADVISLAEPNMQRIPKEYLYRTP